MINNAFDLPTPDSIRQTEKRVEKKESLSDNEVLELAEYYGSKALEADAVLVDLMKEQERRKLK